LGLTNFYQWIVLGFSHVAWALNHVTKGSGQEKFVWGKELLDHVVIDENGLID
jgi:hypothetical protein